MGFSRFLTAAAVAALVGSTAASAQTTTLRMANWLPPSHPLMADIMAPWARMVEEASGGSIRIEIMAAPLGPPPAHFDFAAEGVADITYGVHNYTPSRFVVSTLTDLPFLAPNSSVLSPAYWRVYRDYLAAAGEHAGTHVLSVFTHGPGQVYTTLAPFDTIDGLRNVKVRIGGGMANVVAEALGAVPVQAPVTQAYEILTSGIAEGILFPAESVPAFNIETALNYGTQIPGGLYNVSFFVVMNEDRWNSLTAEQQAAIDSVSGEVLARLAGAAWDAADTAGMETMRAAGVELLEPSDDFLTDLYDLLGPVIDQTLDEIASRGIDAHAAYEALLVEIETIQAE